MNEFNQCRTYFHPKRIKFLARSVVKVITTLTLTGKAVSDSSGVRPERAQNEQEANWIPKSSLIALKILFQKWKGTDVARTCVFGLASLLRP